VIEARGKDKRGNGTATVTVTASFAESGEQTDVEVLTDLVITGKPAQFGHGVISDTSDKLLDQFVSCVSERLADGLGAAEERSVSAAAAAPAQFDESDSEQTIELDVVPAEEEMVAVASTGSVAEPSDPAAEPAPSTARASSQPDYSAQPQSDATESTLSVLSTVGPVLLKRYGPALAVVGLLLFIVIKIIRRKS